MFSSSSTRCEQQEETENKKTVTKVIHGNGSSASPDAFLMNPHPTRCLCWYFAIKRDVLFDYSRRGQTETARLFNYLSAWRSIHRGFGVFVDVCGLPLRGKQIEINKAFRVMRGWWGNIISAKWIVLQKLGERAVFAAELEPKSCEWR